MGAPPIVNSTPQASNSTQPTPIGNSAIFDALKITFSALLRNIPESDAPITGDILRQIISQAKIDATTPFQILQLSPKMIQTIVSCLGKQDQVNLSGTCKQLRKPVYNEAKRLNATHLTISSNTSTEENYPRVTTLGFITAPTKEQLEQLAKNAPSITTIRFTNIQNLPELDLSIFPKIEAIELNNSSLSAAPILPKTVTKLILSAQCWTTEIQSSFLENLKASQIQNLTIANVCEKEYSADGKPEPTCFLEELPQFLPKTLKTITYTNPGSLFYTKKPQSSAILPKDYNTIVISNYDRKIVDEGYFSSSQTTYINVGKEKNNPIGSIFIGFLKDVCEKPEIPINTILVRRGLRSLEQQNALSSLLSRYSIRLGEGFNLIEELKAIFKRNIDPNLGSLLISTHKTRNTPPTVIAIQNKHISADDIIHVLSILIKNGADPSLGELETTKKDNDDICFGTLSEITLLAALHYRPNNLNLINFLILNGCLSKNATIQYTDKLKIKIIETLCYPDNIEKDESPKDTALILQKLHEGGFEFPTVETLDQKISTEWWGEDKKAKFQSIKNWILRNCNAASSAAEPTPAP